MIVAGAAASYLVWAALGASPAPPAPISDERIVVQYTFEPAEDLDYNEFPDDWWRRKGQKFPHYVKVRIDNCESFQKEQSLRIDANGGAAALYSPLITIDDLHSFQFRGRIRTAKIREDQALVTVSLLNHRRQRVQRFLTRPVSGTSDGWTEVSIAPIVPHSGVRFAVIGCHLAPSDEAAVEGQVWFDELTLTQSPRMAIRSDYDAHFLKEDAGVKVTATVSGLEPGRNYKIQFRFSDADGVSQEFDQALTSADSGEASRGLREINWNLDTQPPGFYRLSAALIRDDGAVILQEATSLAVMKLVDKHAPRGEFGWSISAMPREINPDVLSAIASQAGINWVKYPLWDSVPHDDHGRLAPIARLFDQLAEHHIATIGLLSTPPEELRAKFARNWLGVSEIFGTPPHVWMPSLEPVIARFSSIVHHWQLGGEHDHSFQGLVGLSATLRQTRDEINRIGLNSQIGIPWRLEQPPPELQESGRWFVSLSAEQNSSDYDVLRQAWAAADHPRRDRWVVLHPGRMADDPAERANQLVRQMLAAKVAGAEAIFVDQVLDGQKGLLHPDGAPADMFLPWRTAALALQQTRYLGELRLPRNSRNAVFVRGGDLEAHDSEVIVFIWSDNPDTAEEQLYLGENVTQVDLWGRTQPLASVTSAADPNMKEQLVKVSKTPKILMGCSEPIMRWRLETKFALGTIRSEYGAHEDAIVGRNTFPSGVSGKVLLETPSHERIRRTDERNAADASESATGWEAEPREWSLTTAGNEAFRFPVNLTLPSDASLGKSLMKLTFQITADRPYRFEVLCPYDVSAGDLSIDVVDRILPDGRVEIEQIVKNQTSPEEVLDFRCKLKIPDRPRQKVQITKLGNGDDRKFYYLADGEAYRGRELRLQIQEVGGSRILNYNWIVGRDWDEQARNAEKPAASPALPPERESKSGRRR